MVGDLRGEECVAGLRLLGDEALQHVLEGEARAPDGLAVKDLAESPEPIDILTPDQENKGCIQ